ncbi:MAG: hypothetical protein K2W94_02260 [Alphaproteobacteria bacterium]|nr:hypothetical protein [Alphaproteobacteria bacterium]
MTILSSDPLWARAKEVVEREYDAFRTIAPVMPNVGKAEQFLEDLTKKGQVDDIIAMLNKGDGVRGFSKKDRKYYTPEEAKIALNALFLAKQRSPGVFPFKEGIDSFGSKAVQTHRHFVKVAWRLLDPALGYLKAETDFKTNDRAYREFRALVREHMKFGNMNLQSHGEGDTLYVDNGVSVTQQYKYLNLPTIPCFHAYHPADSKISEDGTVLSSYTIYSSLRLKLPTPEIRKFLPQNVQDAIKDISSENLEICVMVQVFLWDVDTLYRPQPWLDPDAPFAQIDYNHAFNVTVSSYPVPTGNTISHAEGPITEGVNTHTEGGTNYIVSSGASPSAGGVLNDKRGTNFSLYSLTQVNNITAYKPESGKVQAPGRYALTLHWMLNENGQTRMQKIAETLSKLSNLKIYHLSELIDTESALNKLYRFGF